MFSEINVNIHTLKGTFRLEKKKTLFYAFEVQIE